MAKNIVIFSDGTGQAGGINFDEARTNVYKLYRACRVGPDTPINPTEQVAFYDPGLGSAADGSQFKIGWMRWIYNLLSMATGLGITNNIIDCYAAIIRLYEDGDRIFLIGFSRGAYTVRSLAGVISYCGIPRRLPDSAPLQLDLIGSRALAEHAVTVGAIRWPWSKCTRPWHGWPLPEEINAEPPAFRNDLQCTGAEPASSNGS